MDLEQFGCGDDLGNPLICFKGHKENIFSRDVITFDYWGIPVPT